MSCGFGAFGMVLAIHKAGLWLWAEEAPYEK